MHPLVRTHGETGRKALYLGGTTEGAWIVGMSRAMKATRCLPNCGITRRTPSISSCSSGIEGDIMMWDNRCTMHRRELLDPASIRIMHRTTTSGERPV